MKENTVISLVLFKSNEPTVLVRISGMFVCELVSDKMTT